MHCVSFSSTSLNFDTKFYSLMYEIHQFVFLKKNRHASDVIMFLTLLNTEYTQSVVLKPFGKILFSGNFSFFAFLQMYSCNFDVFLDKVSIADIRSYLTQTADCQNKNSYYAYRMSQHHEYVNSFSDY